MKRFLIIALTFLSLLLMLIGCVTMDTVKISQLKTMALVSIYCPEKINTLELKPSGGFFTAISTFAQWDKLGLKENLYKLKDGIFKEFPDIIGVNFLDEKQVILNSDLKKLNEKDGLVQLQKVIVTDGYPLISIYNNDKQKESINYIQNADALIFVQEQYKLFIEFSIFGFGALKTKCLIDIKIIDKENNVIFKSQVGGVSKTSIPTAMGGFVADKLSAMCLEAKDNAFVELKRTVEKKFLKK